MQKKCKTKKPKPNPTSSPKNCSYSYVSAQYTIGLQQINYLPS